MRGAADRLGVSQPSVSKHVAALEAALGRKLFERRRGSNVVLSQHGELLEQEIREIHGRKQRLLAGFSGAEGPQEITIYLRNFLFAMMEDRLLEFGPMEGGAEVRFEPLGNTAPIIDLVAAEEHSAALLRLTSILSQTDVDTRLCSVDSCSLYASTQWIAGLPAGADVRKLARFLVPGPGQLHDWICQQLFAFGVAEERIEKTAWYPAAIVKKVQAGEGVTVFLDRHVREHVQAGSITRLDFPIGPLFLQLVSNKGLDARIALQLEDRIRKITA